MNLAFSSVLGAALLAALPLAPVSQQASSQQASGAGDATPASPSGLLVPPATASIAISSEHEQSLADLVESFGRATGLRFVVSNWTRQLLNDTPAGILGGAEVPPEEVYAFVESVLSRHRIVMERLGGTRVPVVGLHGLQTNDSGSIGTWAQVDEDAIDTWREHSALLVQCLVDVTPMDARQAATSLRVLLQSTNYQTVTPMGGETSLLLRGTGRQVADLVDLLKRAAKNEAAFYEARRAAVDAEQGVEGGR